MRFSGHLYKWNDERGFGFIRPVDGGEDVFVHISSLPRPVPGPEEILTFGVALNQDGKKEAVDVRIQRVEQAGLAADRRRAATPSRRAHARDAPDRCVWCAVVAGAVLVACAGAFGWWHYQEKAKLDKAVSDYAGQHSCDGRRFCSQMTSCVEATYFLRNCPDTQMDGNRDGVPCEQQWCN